MEEEAKVTREVKEVEVEAKEMKSLAEVASINEALTGIIIIHKDIPNDLGDKLLDAKLLAGRFIKKLNETREEISNALKANTKEESDAAFKERWITEIKKEVEFPVATLTKKEFKILMDANKEQGLNGGHVEFLYNLFKIQ